MMWLAIYLTFGVALVIVAFILEVRRHGIGAFGWPGYYAAIEGSILIVGVTMLWPLVIAAVIADWPRSTHAKAPR